jgi:hypothetical protein
MGLEQLDALFRGINGGGFGITDMIDQTIRISQMSDEERFERQVIIKMKSFVGVLNKSDEMEMMMIANAEGIHNMTIEKIIEDRKKIEHEAVKRLCDGDEDTMKEVFQIIEDNTDHELEAQLIELMGMCLDKQDG